jgi:hypothetical protein
MKQKMLLMSLALLFSVFFINSAQAGKIAFFKAPLLSTPYSPAYIKQQRVEAFKKFKNQHADENITVYVYLPENTTNYPSVVYWDWEIDFKDGSGNVISSYTTNSTSNEQAIGGVVPPGTYNVEFTGGDGYYKGFDIQAYWQIGGTGYQTHYNGGGDDTGIYLYNVYVSSDSTTYLQIDGND